MAKGRCFLAEIEFTSGQLAQLRRALGLQPGDYLDAAALLAALEAREIIEAEARRWDGWP